MERENLDRLLAEYATGGLSEEDKKKLFAAALEDQEFFEQLIEEDSLREAIEMPGARNRLIDALQEEEVTAIVASVATAASAPTIARRAVPRWMTLLAWSSGIGVVFVSAGITYFLLTDYRSMNMVAVRKDYKPFVAPPESEVPPPPATVEEPPKLVGALRKDSIPSANIPLPSAPPPAASPVAGEIAKDRQMADAVLRPGRPAIKRKVSSGLSRLRRPPLFRNGVPLRPRMRSVRARRPEAERPRKKRPKRLCRLFGAGAAMGFGHAFPTATRSTGTRP